MDPRQAPIIRQLRQTPFWVPLRDLVRRALRLLARVGLRQREDKIVQDAQSYWTGDALSTPNMFHWRGEDGIGDDGYDRMGDRNAERFLEFAAASAFPTVDLRILEWGCGGGSILRGLAPHAKQLYGIDVSVESLQRAGEELADTGVPFTPILTTVGDPEAVLDGVAEPVDLFVCVNVMEVLPSPAYGERILRIARELLRPGGLAIIQTRYTTRRSPPRCAPSIASTPRR